MLDELDLASGAPVVVVRIGDGLVLIPEQSRFQDLCNSIANVLESHGGTPAALQASLPEARHRVFARRLPRFGCENPKKAKGWVK